MNSIKSFCFSLFCLLASSCRADISYNDYILIHEKDYQFSTGFNESYVINTFNTIDECKTKCIKNKNCK